MLTDRRLIYLSLVVVFVIGPLLLAGLGPFVAFLTTVIGPYALLALLTALILEMLMRWQQPPKEWPLFQKLALGLLLWIAFLLTIVVLF